jgi:ribosomal protein S18 acetylase RimI-like enzyme
VTLLITPTTPPAPVVARATGWDRGGMVAALSAAFADDPVFAWIEPDPTSRHAALPALFDGFATLFARHDTSFIARVGGASAGAALWAPPDAAPDPADEHALDEGMAMLAPDAQGRAAVCIEMFAACHPAEPAWHLAFLGVTPDRQGTGVGSALLRRVLQRCDERGEAAHLEATSERNRALYERHGFRLIEEIPLPDGPTAYSMWRKPVMPPQPPWLRPPSEAGP